MHGPSPATAELPPVSPERSGGKDSLDIVLVVSKLFVVEAKLIHKVGRHLLYLIL